ncbi:flagellar assembly protein H [Vibrio sp. ZSDE26]|uniref:Flagellar assembly protein FliH n=1 Tax=Vibrio amylolyticus TaxID=2847292 RepID=A0A9X1XJ43_9VIBR|nr:flagellar assembly protein FliH [Vibrio amylolyticus]MCK6263366.1 flagellar assembly protein H [Vibrio amylolyticus]
MFKRNRVMRLAPHEYRSHRFPPLVDAAQLAAPAVAQTGQAEQSDDFGFDDFDMAVDLDREFSFELDGDAALAESTLSLGEEKESTSGGDIQEQYSQGFQLGMNKGYEEGLQEGIEKGQVQGFEEGLGKGQQQGIEQGISEGKKEFMIASAPFVSMYEKVERLFADQELRQRELVCELVQKVAQQVIRCELALQPQQILALVEETLETLPSEPQGIKVLMAQEEFSQIEKVASEKIAEWNIICDPSLRQGDCRIITKTAEADAGCELRLETCMNSVKEHLLDENKDVDITLTAAAVNRKKSHQAELEPQV